MYLEMGGAADAWRVSVRVLVSMVESAAVLASSPVGSGRRFPQIIRRCAFGAARRIAAGFHRWGKTDFGAGALCRFADLLV